MPSHGEHPAFGNDREGARCTVVCGVDMLSSPCVWSRTRLDTLSVACFTSPTRLHGGKFGQCCEIESASAAVSSRATKLAPDGGNHYTAPCSAWHCWSVYLAACVVALLLAPEVFDTQHKAYGSQTVNAPCGRGPTSRRRASRPRGTPLSLHPPLHHSPLSPYQHPQPPHQYRCRQALRARKLLLARSAQRLPHLRGCSGVRAT